MRRLAIVLGVVVLLVVVLLGAAWLALQRIDWNAYKQPLAERVERATGRSLDLAGDVDLEIGLRPGVSIEDVAFANADWGSRPEMATLDRLLVRVQILPLFSGEVVVDRIELVGLDLLLETAADGRVNWQFEPREAAPETRDEDEQTGPDAPAEDGSGAEPPAVYALLVQEAELRDALVVMRDAASGEERQLAVRQLLATTSVAGGPLMLEANASLDEAPVRLTAEVGGLRDVTSGGPLDVDLQLAAGGASLGVWGRVAQPMDVADLDLSVHLDAPRLSPLGAVLGTELPDLGPVALELKLGGRASAYTVRGLSLAVGGTKFTGELDAALGGERPRVDARLSSPGIDAADFRDPKAASARVRPAPGIQLASEGANAAERLFSDEPLPVDGLAALDATLTLDADRVVADTLQLEDLELGAALDRSRLDVNRLVARLAGGSLDAGLVLDARRPPPTVKLRGKLRGVRTGDLVAAQGNEMFQGGPLDLDFDLSGRGGSPHEIAASLAGRLQLSMGEATVRNEYAAVALSDLETLSRGMTTSGATVTCAWADFALEEGIARPDGLVIHLTSLVLFGEGRIDLGRERLDLVFDRQAQQASASGVLPPFALEGPLAEPRAAIDPRALAGKAVDLGAALLGEGVKLQETSTDCREALALYRKYQTERGTTAESATRTILDLQDKDKRKKAVKRIKDLFDR